MSVGAPSDQIKDGLETAPAGGVLVTQQEPSNGEGSRNLHSWQLIGERRRVYFAVASRIRQGLRRLDAITKTFLLRLSESRLSGSVWPPYRAMAHEAGPIRLAATGVSAVIIRLAETVFGQPTEAAATTVPLPGLRASARQADTDVVVLACSSLHAGGAERQIAVTARGLRDRGLQPVFVGHDNHGPVEAHHYAALLNEVGIPIHNAANEGAGLKEHDLHSLDQARRELQWRCEAMPAGLGSLVAQHVNVFRRLRPAVVHSWLDYNNVTAGVAALWAGVPRVVLGFRNVNPTHFALYQPFFRPLYRLMLADPRVKLVANSVAGAKDYAAWLGVPPGAIQIIPNAFEARMHNASSGATSERPADTDPVVLGVFRFYHEKDPLLFVRTAAVIRRSVPTARFRLLGSGPFEDRIRAEAATLGIEQQLELVGTQKSVFDRMRQANLLLHCSRKEGLPNVLLEAQAAGLPIVTTAVGGCPEAIEQGVTGLAVSRRTPDALARAAVELLQSPTRLALARTRGPDSVAERFGLTPMLDRTLAAYRLD